jgi:OsmC subfamily peroxiredoxin
MSEFESAPEAPRFENGAWVLSRYSDVSTALRDKRLSAASARTQGDAGIFDEAAHAQFRELARAELSSARVREWQILMDPLAQRVLLGLERDRPVDLVREFAEPWGLAVALTVTGADAGSAERLNRLAHEVFLAAAEPYDAVLAANAARATAELARELGRALDVQTFVALSQTLPCFLANAWLTLLQHPRETQQLRAQPDRLSEAMEELLRYATPSRAQFRRALEAVNINGATIAKGQRVILMLAAANRDPAEFPEPDRFDPRRGASSHLAFGAGAHACVGAALIRMAAASATRAFLDRFAGAELYGPIQWRGGFAIRFPAALPVRRQSIRRQYDMIRSARAHWQGDLKSGSGTISTASGILTATPYSFSSRFERGTGTNPEELLAAAHAGCFTMALSAQLAQAGLKAESLETSCTIELDKQDGGFAITESHLQLRAKVPGATQEAFDQAVNAAKTGCPVSKLYNTNITLDALLET